MRKSALAAALLLLVSGCGGGGGSGGGGGRLNSAPTFGNGNYSLAENITVVSTLAASDADNDALTFTVTGGPDSGQFTTNGAQLAFRTPPNFEAPADANGDNVYLVTVTVSDGKASVSGNLTIEVKNDREGVTVRRIASIGERWMGGTVLDNGQVMLLTAHKVQRFDLATEARSQVVEWSADDGARGRFTSIASARTAFSGQMLVTARLANGLAGMWALSAAGGNAFDSYWSPPLLSLPYDNMVEDVGATVGICPSGNNCIAWGSLGKPEGATSDRYGSLLELPFNADPYAGATLQLFQPPVRRASGLRLPLAFALGPDPSQSPAFLILDQGSTRFDEINRLQPGQTVDFGWPYREGSEVLSAGGGPFNDPELVIARGSAAKQSLGATALAYYRGPLPSLAGRMLVAGRDGRIYSVANAALANGTIDGAAAYEDRTEDFQPDTGSLDHVVAILSTGTKTLLLDRDGDLFIFG
ncbi:hypothetical protein [Sphingomonas sp. LHG3406-1]|uniref:Ig-like domain-containing protein n=1 Tax=Sphingomonas sp. LHG3406-1 TaxID=2804617 RepID=UPI00261204BC|nr:hypothetical protein [Sphingomonas sp. LHG3406-1]